MYVLIPSGEDTHFEVHQTTDTGIAFTGISLQKEIKGWKIICDKSFSTASLMAKKIHGKTHQTTCRCLARIKDNDH